MARLVITHSTYIEGLIPRLKSLSMEDKISTITPGVISRVKGRCETLTLRISIETKGGYKLLARKGSLAQEVFIVTSLNKLDLEKLILRKSKA